MDSSSSSSPPSSLASCLASTSEPSELASAVEEKKIFVGGLAWGTKNNDLMNYFLKYGDVRHATVAVNWQTGRGRGFGFVDFVDPTSATSAIEDKPHVLLGKQVEVKRAIRRGELFRNNDSNKKIFVGGLPRDLTKEEFQSYFEKFGTIKDIIIMYDKIAQRSRGFGFITFESEDSVRAVTQQVYYELNHKRVEVKLAIPKVSSSYADDNLDAGHSIFNPMHGHSIYDAGHLTFNPMHGIYVDPSYAYSPGIYQCDPSAQSGGPAGIWNSQGLFVPHYYAYDPGYQVVHPWWIWGCA